ncbi:MAG: quinate 5-dehydrogenase [Armatimonadetes bacterium]|nr:quinate 5-dehydrogenase [Armatimonadota bacterium]
MTTGTADGRVRRIVSVSLGSSRRDKQVEIEVMGVHFLIERRGTDGDSRRARQMLAALDGKVDAIGLGGINLWLQAGARRYPIRDAHRMIAGVTRTPVVDGSGLKSFWERHLILDYLPRTHGLTFRARRVLLVASVDRFAMAQAFAQAGAETIFGDLIFGLGIPLPLRSLRTVEILAAVALPILTRLPFRILYPVGEKQETITPRHERFYRWAEIIAGDFHLIRRFMPDDLRGKEIFTNTVTEEDVAALRDRGVHRLITSTPEMEGRSFGTNVIEGFLVALSGRRPEQLQPEDYFDLLQRASLRPRVEVLNPLNPPAP